MKNSGQKDQAKGKKGFEDQIFMKRHRVMQKVIWRQAWRNHSTCKSHWFYGNWYQRISWLDRCI